EQERAISSREDTGGAGIDAALTVVPRLADDHVRESVAVRVAGSADRPTKLILEALADELVERALRPRFVGRPGGHERERRAARESNAYPHGFEPFVRSTAERGTVYCAQRPRPLHSERCRTTRSDRHPTRSSPA